MLLVGVLLKFLVELPWVLGAVLELNRGVVLLGFMFALFRIGFLGVPKLVFDLGFRIAASFLVPL